MSKDYLQKLFGLDGQVAVVIGGTGVLGGALAEGIAAAGAHVVVAGRNMKRGKDRAKTIREQGGSASCAAVDVVSRESVESLLGTILQEHPRVHCLVNCAGANDWPVRAPLRPTRGS